MAAKQALTGPAPALGLRAGSDGPFIVPQSTANISNSFFGDGNAAQVMDSAMSTNSSAAYGGAIYVAGGTVTLNGDTIGNPFGANGSPSNTATGPSMSVKNKGYGGGLYVAGGNVTLTNDTIWFNVAGGFHGGGVLWGGGYGSYGYGGGIDIASAAQVYIDSLTVAHTTNNNPNNIVGRYTLLP